MKITSFNPQEIYPSLSQFGREGGAPGATAAQAAPTGGDVVNIQSLAALEDIDADALLADTLSLIAQDSQTALAAHGGLSASRVAELLAM